MELAILSKTTTMTSREIAELVGSTHDNVLKAVRRLISEGVVFCKESPRINQQNGQTYQEFTLDFKDTMVVLLGYGVKFRSSIMSVIANRVGEFEQILNAIRDFEVPEECADMYVYAIRNTTTGNIKLGISRNPEQRLKQLQTGNDCALELVAYSKAGNRFQDETALHHAHAAAHIRGEWFDQSAAFAITQ